MSPTSVRVLSLRALTPARTGSYNDNAIQEFEYTALPPMMQSKVRRAGMQREYEMGVGGGHDPYHGYAQQIPVARLKRSGASPAPTSIAGLQNDILTGSGVQTGCATCATSRASCTTTTLRRSSSGSSRPTSSG